MRYYILISFVFLFSLDSNSQEDKEDSSDFNYSLISVDLIQTDETAVGAKLSLPLPGGLYVVLERRAEGVDTSKAIYNLAKKLKIEMPICINVYEILFNNKDPKNAITELMNRKLIDE